MSEEHERVECEERVYEPPSYVRHHPCGRQVKERLQRGTTGLTVEVCGIHARSLRKRGWVRA